MWEVGQSGWHGLVQHGDGVAYKRFPTPGQGLKVVAAISPEDAWAVGRSGILHWDGTAWKRVKAPCVGILQAVSADSAEILIEHRDGTAWSVVS